MQNLKRAVKYFESIGYRVALGQNLKKQHRYMAGTPEERAADIMDFYKDRDIKAIFCARGGCGSQMVLDCLDYEVIKKHPKPIFGLSDNTALQLGIYAKTKAVGYTGISLVRDFKAEKLNPTVAGSLKAVLNKESQTIKAGKTVHGGTAEGVLIGGCLSMIRSMCGTQYLPDLKDKILLIEDVSEYTYKIELMLTQLRQCKNFDKVKGIIFGDFKDCKPQAKADGSIDDVIKDFCKGLKMPIIKDFPYGHKDKRYILPIGGKIKLDADKCVVEA